MLAATASIAQPAPVDAAARQVTIAFPTAAGADTGGAAYDQDRACINPDTRTIGVFDGHGDYGALAAQTAADVVAASAVATPFTDLFATAEAAIREAMRAQITAEGKPLHEYEGALYRQVPPPQRHFAIPFIQYRGGSTASVVRIAADGALSVANVGDSDVVVFDGPTDPGRTLIADHTPTCLAEWERVHAAHPRTRFRFNNPNYWAPERPVWTPVAGDAGGWQLNPVGGFLYTDVRNTWGAYVTVGDNTESLAMTRALGDFHLKRHGVIAEPESQEVPAPAPGTVRAVILGSDGVWDTLQFEAARDLVYRADLVGRPDEATAALLELARTTAHGKFGPVVDNLICAVVYITVPAVEEAPAAEEAAADTGTLPAPPDEEEPPAEELPLHATASGGGAGLCATASGGGAAEEEEPPAAEPDAQSLACGLHGPMVQPGGCGLWYTMNERGEYGMYAPPCNGCSYGASEQARVAARWRLEEAMTTTRREPTDANKERLRAAIEALGEWSGYYDYLAEAAWELLGE